MIVIGICVFDPITAVSCRAKSKSLPCASNLIHPHRPARPGVNGGGGGNCPRVYNTYFTCRLSPYSPKRPDLRSECRLQVQAFVFPRCRRFLGSAPGATYRAMPLSEQQIAEIDALRVNPVPTLRATVPALEAMLYSAAPVLDHGFVRVVDYMGDDAAVVQAA